MRIACCGYVDPSTTRLSASDIAACIDTCRISTLLYLLPCITSRTCNVDRDLVVLVHTSQCREAVLGLECQPYVDFGGEVVGVSTS
jgi:hypothetical protein